MWTRECGQGQDGAAGAGVGSDTEAGPGATVNDRPNADKSVNGQPPIFTSQKPGLHFPQEFHPTEEVVVSYGGSNKLSSRRLTDGYCITGASNTTMLSFTCCI